MLDGRVKTLHPKVHGGILARRDLPGARGGARGARHSADRPRRRQPLSVPRDRREAGLHARRGDREHRHRRAVDGARGREELAARRRRRRSGRLRRAARRARRRTAARCRPRRASRWRARRSRTRRPTTARSRTGSPRADRTARRRRFPIGSTCRRRRCRTCATARTRTSRRRSIATRRPRPGRIAHVPAAAGQGAVVQQHRRFATRRGSA